MDTFFISGLPLDWALVRQHDPGLVLLSVLVSVVTSGMAIHLAGLAARISQRLPRQLTVAAGGLALGGGIWAMHFIAILAFPLCASGDWDVGSTLMSLAFSTMASFLALALLARPSLKPGALVGAGVLLGSGIGAMHYMGIAALECSLRIRYDPGGFALSVVMVILLAVLVLWILRRLQGDARQHPWRATLLAGVVMGCALAGMHYTSMAALRLTEPMPVGASDLPDPLPLALGVASVTLLMGFLLLALNLVLRFRALFRTAQERESHLRAMVDTAVEGIVMIDANGIVLLYNGAAQKLLGWTAEEMLGDSINRIIPGSHRAQHDGYIQRFLQTGQSQIIGVGREVDAVHKDGRQIPMFVTVGQVKVPGTPLFVAFLTDLSRMRALEQQQRTLRSAKEQAEADARARSAFMATMSHEIRTPMNAVLGFTEAVLDTPLNAIQRRHLELARQAARTLLHLLNDILDTSELDKGSVVLEIADFSPHAVWLQLLASLKIAADRKGLSLTLDEGPEVPLYLRGDALRLQQIVLNLLDNAVKFTERGSVTLRVRYTQGQLRLWIIDTGIGIPADKLQRIFDPFAQADASTTRRYGGTGLGTTIARQLTDLMGGTITVSSTLDQGTCFTVTLPLPEGTVPVVQVPQVESIPSSPEVAVPTLDAAQKEQVRLASDRLAQALSDGEWVQAPLDLLARLLPATALSPLTEALDAFDFDQAQQRLQDLRAQWLGDADETTP